MITLFAWEIKEEGLKQGYMQRERWSILSDVVKYVDYNEHPIDHYRLEVKVPEEKYGIKMYKSLQDGQQEVKEIGFDPYSERFKQNYLAVLGKVKSDIMYTAIYNENSDIWTTYLGTSIMKRHDKLKQNI